MPRLIIRRLTLAMALLVALAAAALHQPRATYACSCMQPGPPAEAAAQSQAVFAGTVSAIAPAASPQGQGALLVTFDVQQTWKGPEGPQLTVVTSDSSASCGYSFTPGEEYLVYSVAQEGQLATGLCSRTAPLASAGEDLAALGEGTSVAAGPGAVTQDRIEVPWLPIALAAAALLIGAALFGPTLARRRAR